LATLRGFWTRAWFRIVFNALNVSEIHGHFHGRIIETSRKASVDLVDNLTNKALKNASPG
jgi:hypothetical protein